MLAVQFTDGVAATFPMNGTASDEKRTLQRAGQRRRAARGLDRAATPRLARRRAHRRPGSPLDHFGGDPGLIAHFVTTVERGRPDEVRASGRMSLASRLLCFAAEEARRDGRVVDVDEIRSRATADARASRRDADC
ncbi:hypothetical protein K2Z84_28095 [Candidatus Binatia bacterium]|nr:hypothetical protein [Candidatus Binatia bacterium]